MEIDSQGLIGFAGEVLRQAGIAGLVLVIIVIAAAAYFILRVKGVGTKPPSASTSELKGIKAELGTLNRRFGEFDRRLTDVERDLEDRPTRDELHQIDKSIIRIDERLNGFQSRVEDRFRGVEKVTNATNAGVNRLEEFMINASTKGSK